MKTKCFAAAVVLFLIALSGCNGGGGNSRYPSEFATMSDADKVAYLMERVPADSVARFVCDASLGRIKGVKIDTLAMATLYAYENYRDTALTRFSNEYDRYVEMQPLADRMRLYALAGQVDPQGLGYELGLSYVGQIRSKEMTVAQVEEELKALKEACKDDTATYTRFMTGFKVALSYDHGKDLSEDIYRRFAK